MKTILFQDYIEMKKMFGVITAMVTPFTENDEIDVETLKAYTNYLISKGVNCLYPCGTTGEMLKMSIKERELVAETVIKANNGKANVFIHVGAPTTKETIELAQHALKAGADGIGVVTPQFFHVSPREMEEFYVAISKSLPDNFPIYIYGIPQCAGNDIDPETIEKILKRTKNIVGIKYSWADFVKIKDFLLINNGNFDVVVGPDRFFLPALAMGCIGTVTGVSNCGPEDFVEVYKYFTENDMIAARKAQDRATELCEATSNGANMAIFKYTMTKNGLPFGHMRAPALDLTKDERAEIDIKLQNMSK